MIKVKDGYVKLIGENLYGDVNRVLLSNGGDKIIGNAKDNIPINNGTINANLNAELLGNKSVKDFRHTKIGEFSITPNLGHYGSSVVKSTQYYKISITGVTNVWTMLNLEISLTENHGTPTYGKLLIYIEKNASNNLTSKHCTLVGNFSVQLKVYCYYEGDFNIYIAGDWNYPTIEVTKALFGDTAAMYSAKDITLTYIDSLPSAKVEVPISIGLTSSNYSSYALPLTGGTIKNGSTSTPLIINTTNTAGDIGIRFSLNNDSKGWIGYNSSYGTYIYTYGGSHKLGIKDNGIAYCDSNTILHSGNYTSYTVKKDGTGASGTWGINISGNASTAKYLSTKFIFGGGQNKDKYYYVGSITLRSAWDGYHSIWNFTGKEGAWGGNLYIGFRLCNTTKEFSGVTLEWLSLTDQAFTNSVYLTYTDTTETIDDITKDIRICKIYIKIPENYKTTIVNTISESESLTLVGTTVAEYEGTLQITSSGNRSITAIGAQYVFDYNTTTPTPIYVGYSGSALTSSTAQYLAAYGTTSSGARCIKDISAAEAKIFIGLGNVQNTAFYKRSTSVNGAAWDMAGTNSSNAFTIYAPTTAGTSGQVLISSGGTPSWTNQSNITVGAATKLATARTLWGQSFDGSANVSGSLSSVTNISMSGRLTLNTSIVDHSTPMYQCIAINCAAPPEGTTITNKNAPGIGFHISTVSLASLVYYPGIFKFIDSSATAYVDVAANKFIKADSSDSYVLLGGGGHKALSALQSEYDSRYDNRYVNMSGDTMTGQLTISSVDNSSGIAYGGAIQLREKGNVGDTQTAWEYSPAISFHWSYRSIKRLGMDYQGSLKWDDNLIYHAGNLTKSTLGLGNVDNTADVDKNVNSATKLKYHARLTTQEAIDNFLEASVFKVAIFKTTEQNSIGMADHDGMLLSLPWDSTTYGAQVAIDDITSGSIKVRGKANDSWGSWHSLLHNGNSSVSKSGETLSVKINGTEQSLTNTWRSITDSYSGTSSSISLSQKGAQALYNALVDGNAATLEGYSSNKFVKKDGGYSISTTGTAPYNYVHLFRIAVSSTWSNKSIDFVVRTRNYKFDFYINIDTGAIAYGYNESTSQYNTIKIYKETKTVRSGQLYYLATEQTSGYNYFDVYLKTTSWQGGYYDIINIGGTGTLVFEDKRIYLDSLPSGCVEVEETLLSNADRLDGYHASSFALASQIPTLGNGTITIKQGGTSKGSFTMNQSSNAVIELSDNNTTYSAGIGLSLSGTTFNINAGNEFPVGDSNLTDGTQILTSYASNSGFDDTNAVGTVYKRNASCIYGYIKGKLDSVYQAKGSYLTSHQTIYNLTLQAGTFSAATFDPNGSARTVNVPTHTSHLTNDSGFITNAALSNYLPLAGGAMTSGARISASGGNLYVGNSDNAGWLYLQDCASQNGQDYWKIHATGSAMFQILEVKQNLTVVGSITAENNNFYTTSSGAFWSSDRRLKDNISSARNLNIDSLIREFDWKDTGKHSWGFIAQELLEVLPEAVNYNEDNDRYSVNYDVAHSAAIASLNAKIKQLELRIKELEDGKVSNE